MAMEMMMMMMIMMIMINFVTCRTRFASSRSKNLTWGHALNTARYIIASLLQSLQTVSSWGRIYIGNNFRVKVPHWRHGRIPMIWISSSSRSSVTRVDTIRRDNDCVSLSKFMDLITTTGGIIIIVFDDFFKICHLYMKKNQKFNCPTVSRMNSLALKFLEMMM